MSKLPLLQVARRTIRRNQREIENINAGLIMLIVISEKVTPFFINTDTNRNWIIKTRCEF